MEKITVYINNGIPNSQTLLKVPPTLHSPRPAFVWPFFFLALSLSLSSCIDPPSAREAEPNAANVMTYLWLQHLHVSTALLNKACRLNVSVCGLKEVLGSTDGKEKANVFPECLFKRV